MKVLIIERNHSECGECGRHADPYEGMHTTGMGYGEQPPGCGAVWTHVTSSYEGLESAIRGMRPDLTYIEPAAWGELQKSRAQTP